MKKLLIYLLLFTMLLPPFTVSAEDIDHTKQIKEFMDKVIDAYKIPGASLAVVRDGQTIYQDNWGQMSDGSPVTSDTPFLIGSVSKPLTALAIMMLVEDDLLRLDEPIETYIPTFTYQTDSQASITVRHLLEQTSGMSAFDGLKVTDQNTHAEDAITLAVNKLNGIILSHTPGEVYEYNSANYLLLGAIIEEVTNGSFAEFIESHIFSPLGMHHSAADYETAIEKGYVPGFESWFGHPVKSAGLYDNGGAAYGYMTSSANDLTRFLTFMLDGGDLLTEQSLDQIKMPPEEDRRYGLGWHFSRSSMRFPYHTGATPDYRAEVLFIPEQNVGAVLLMNKYHELEAVHYLSILGGVRAIMNGTNPNLPELTHSTQWITLGVILILAILFVLNLISVRRKPTLNKKLWGTMAAISIILAVGLIPLFSYLMNTPWKAIQLFVPDIAFLLQCLVVLFAIHGFLLFFFSAFKRRVKE